MSWARATVEQTCSVCQRTIEPGEPVRRGVQVPGYRWCEGCAAVRLEETAPDVLDDEVTLYVPAATPVPRLPFARPDHGLDLALKREQQARRAPQRASTWQRDGRMSQIAERDR